MMIRAESAHDIESIAAVVSLAFGRDDESKLVESLRHDAAFIPELSLVAVEKEQVIGHLLFTRAAIVGAEKSWPALALAPLAVRPEYQRSGVGTALVRHGLQQAQQLGHMLVVVLGHAHYYPRFGFTSAHAAGIAAPFPVNDESFMALTLTPGGLARVRGTIRYAPPFATL